MAVVVRLSKESRRRRRLYGDMREEDFFFLVIGTGVKGADLTCFIYYLRAKGGERLVFVAFLPPYVT
jgi:hypothetical protein